MYVTRKLLVYLCCKSLLTRILSFTLEYQNVLWTWYVGTSTIERLSSFQSISSVGTPRLILSPGKIILVGKLDNVLCP